MSKFAQLVSKFKSKGESDKEAKGTAAAIGRKKFGKSNFQGAAAKKEAVESYMKSKKK